MQEVQIRNTFIEVHSSDEDDDDGLPRSTSDQTHARRHPVRRVVVPPPTVESIPEDQEVDASLSRTKPGVVIDDAYNTTTSPPPKNPVVGSSVDGLPGYVDGGVVDGGAATTHPAAGDYTSTSMVRDTSLFLPNIQQEEEVGVVGGTLSDDLHTFTKLEYEGRLSMVTEEQIRRHGVHRYMISFDSGEISPADGVGYAFSSQLPCKKNIQKIDSIFLNRRGHICSRTHSDVSRRHAFVAPLELGRVVDITVDVDRCLIYFGVWAPPPPQSHNNNNNRAVAVKLTPDYIINNYHLLACATVEFGDVAATCRYGSTGHFCTVLKNTNVTVSFICPDKKQ
ncbi:hypothetical protein FOZ62_010546 [Perkinsus olseni]|uniref:Uncharacterized protein n=1 Tax=Perkinsus olseni TaxID=32597 RepID=A0A7J6T283_PEROL|nr:hypothetical protein FOZ62_010546 [Perkinsus olseni]